MKTKKTLLLLLILAIISKVNAQNGQEALSIDANGNVGIGISRPSARLEVNGNVKFTLGNSPSQGAAVSFTGTNDCVKITTQNLSGQSPINLMLGDERANVGIGTASPREKLEVNGRIRDLTGFLVPVGTVVAYAGKDVPVGWLVCDGKTNLTSNTMYNDLQKVLGATAVPDLRSSFIVGAGQGANLSNYAIGQTGGEEKHQLSIAEMPAHSHRYHKASYNYGHRDGGEDWSRYGHQDQQDNGTTSNTGGGQAHENRPPYYALTYIIKY